MATILVLAPHPDDETLGCGGTLLWHRARNDDVQWLIGTEMTQPDFSPHRIANRQAEIDRVSQLYGFSAVHRLGIATTQIDRVPLGELVGKLGRIFKDIGPDTLYLPHIGDAHSDHRILVQAALAATKWFRLPCLRNVYAYETLSETNFSMTQGDTFRPNVYVDISAYLERKLDAMAILGSELAPHPFPRSVESIRALAALRGSEAGFGAAEAFMLLKERRSA